MTSWLYKLFEQDKIPEWVIRKVIITNSKRVLAENTQSKLQDQHQKKMDFIQELKQMPIAIHTDDANQQHYMVDSEFFHLTLGKHLKYSCSYYPNGDESLDEAEEKMLNLYFERADLQDGQDILELGCGWGSLTLAMARRLPKATIIGISNSSSQKQWILHQAEKENLQNIEIITVDMNDLHLQQQFDRVISIEMFEHMKNYQKLLHNISQWMKAGAFLFIHIFSHKSLCYHYESKGEEDWMAKNFFSGGTMPSHDLLLYFQEHVTLINQWQLDGTHYGKTSRDWGAKIHQHKEEILRLFSQNQSPQEALKQWVYWKTFYLSCEEFFNYRNGTEWGVSHYLFEKK